MDMMEIRRQMMGVIAGMAGSIGEFTKYEKKTLTFPNADDTSSWNTGAIVPCSFTPSVVIFYGGSEVNGNIVRGVLTFDYHGNSISVGGVKVKNTQGTLTQYALFENPNASAQRYKFENGNLYICRASSGVYWSNSDSYTFEFYA